MASAFAATVDRLRQLPRVASLRVTLYGSLAWLGKGHRTDKAVILGLAREMPDTIDPGVADEIVMSVRPDRTLQFAGRRNIAFDPELGIVMDQVAETPVHPNKIELTACDSDGATIESDRWCFAGGAFVALESHLGLPHDETSKTLPFPLRSGQQLLAMEPAVGVDVADMVFANDLTRESAAEVERRLTASSM
ncbi:hypothetical protein ACVWXN_006807 [Bradyrhizobium sp. i1.4.4]